MRPTLMGSTACSISSSLESERSESSYHAAAWPCRSCGSHQGNRAAEGFPYQSEDRVESKVIELGLQPDLPILGSSVHVVSAVAQILCQTWTAVFSPPWISPAGPRSFRIPTS